MKRSCAEVPRQLNLWIEEVVFELDGRLDELGRIAFDAESDNRSKKQRELRKSNLCAAGFGELSRPTRSDSARSSRAGHQ